MYGYGFHPGFFGVFALLHVIVVVAFLYFAYDIAKSLRTIADKMDKK